MSLKVLYQSRSDLFDIPGGDTFQLNHTKSAIEKKYNDINIDVSTKLHEPRIDKYDIVHLFNLDWIGETYIQAKWAKKHKKIVVLSAIHHSKKELERYEELYRFDIRRIVNFFVPFQGIRDVLKNVYRSMFDYRSFYPTVMQMLKGPYREQREIVKMVDSVFVQTKKEVKDIKDDYNIKDFDWELIYNGVDFEKFEKAKKEDFVNQMKSEYGLDVLDKKIILNVGRIEARKNQLSLIQAFLELKKKKGYKDYLLVFIGGINRHHPEYLYRFKNIVNQNKDIYYLGLRKQEFVASCMKSSFMYVHPSWFETTGLVCLEAMYSGLKVIATGERTREYLGSNALYCDPASVESIVDAIMKIKDFKPNAQSMLGLKTKYSWDKTAVQTVKAYEKLYKIKRN